MVHFMKEKFFTEILGYPQEIQKRNVINRMKSKQSEKYYVCYICYRQRKMRG
jgi:hypothetical protein